MEDARSLNTIAAPRQKLMNERATVVATTTFCADDGSRPSCVDILRSSSLSYAAKSLRFLYASAPDLNEALMALSLAWSWMRRRQLPEQYSQIVGPVSPDGGPQLD